MKNKKYINIFLLIGILFMSALFIVGCGLKGSNDYQVAPEDINGLDTKHKQEYEELEKQKSYLHDLKNKYLHQRVRISQEYAGRRNSLLKQPLYPLKVQLDNIDIKINQVEHKGASIQVKMDKILNESTKTCFPKNTKVVMFDGSLKDIDTIVKGDKVMIYDIANDVISESTVNKKFINTNNHLYIINDNIKTTSYERFLTKDGWKRTHDLSTKDSIFDGNSFVKVDSIYKVKKDLTVYNLNINSTHNFFVSSKDNDEWFLIHNCGGEGGGGK